MAVQPTAAAVHLDETNSHFSELSAEVCCEVRFEFVVATDGVKLSPPLLNGYLVGSLEDGVDMVLLGLVVGVISPNVGLIGDCLEAVSHEAIYVEIDYISEIWQRI